MKKPENKKQYMAKVRTACLYRNKIFQSDCKRLRELEESQDPDFKNSKLEFIEKWGINRQGISWIPEEAVNFIRSHPEGYITIKVDLLFPKSKILAEVEELVEAWQTNYKDDFEDLFRSFDHEENGEEIKFQIQKRKKDAENKYQIREIDLYRRYLHIFDLKSEGKSWNQIKSILEKENAPIASLKGIRNEHEAATKLINHGVPGFKPFPTE